MRRWIWILLLCLPSAASADDILAIPTHPLADVDSLTAHAGRIIRSIDITGYKVTKDYIIQREIRSRVGQPFDPALLRDDIQRLENLSIFAEVKVAAVPTSDSGVAIAINLREMPPILPMIGVLYTEENGFSVGPGISSMNLGGHAIAVSGRIYFGGAKQAWGRATWPWITGNHVSVELYTANLKREDVRNGFNESSVEFTGKVGTYLGDSGRLTGRLTLFKMRSDVDGITLSPDNEDKQLSLSVLAGIDTRDSFRVPRHGWKNEIEVAHTGFLDSDVTLQTLTVDVRHWLPVGRSQRTMLSGLLTMQSGTIFVDVPTYLRYHIGGANSVRGYDVQGPTEALAGKNQLIGTVEHAFTVFPVRRFDFFKLSFGLGFEIAALADAGIAWNTDSEFAIDKVRAGIGVGLHLLVPGSEMIRFDVAWDGKDEVRFHLASGSKPVAQRSRNR